VSWASVSQICPFPIEKKRQVEWERGEIKGEREKKRKRARQDERGRGESEGKRERERERDTEEEGNT